MQLFTWPPPKRNIKVGVVIPTSILSVEQTLYEKTKLLGYLARALAIFRVDEVVVFVDTNEDDRSLIEHILNLILTPPYLRKKIISRNKLLKYVGVLPPLNIFTHPESKDVSEGVIREGLVLRVRGKYVKVYLGLDEDAIVKVPEDLINTIGEGSRLYVKIIQRSPLRGVVVRRDEIPWYLGFSIKFLDNVKELINYLRISSDVNVITSKYGLNASNVIRELLPVISSTGGIRLFFGNPKMDFDEILGQDFNSIKDLVRLKINTIPLQGTRTVRTIEAIYASLAVINELLYVHTWHDSFK